MRRLPAAAWSVLAGSGRLRAELAVVLIPTLALTLAAGRSGGIGALLALGAWAVLAAASLLLLGVQRGHPRGGSLGPDNVATLARGLAAPALALSFRADPTGALALGLLAGGLVTDVLDGRLARRLGPTPMGRLADPLADTAFFVSGAIALAGAGRAPGWLLAVVAARYLVPVVGVAWATMALGRRVEVGHTRWGQASTAWTGAALALGAILPPGRSGALLAACYLAVPALAVPAVLVAATRSGALRGDVKSSLMV
ncbi:MAG: CDP-alcohol phosphatidyltransferase family protein [Candidatus Dormibacteria bacterium]